MPNRAALLRWWLQLLAIALTITGCAGEKGSTSPDANRPSATENRSAVTNLPPGSATHANSNPRGAGHAATNSSANSPQAIEIAPTAADRPRRPQWQIKNPAAPFTVTVQFATQGASVLDIVPPDEMPAALEQMRHSLAHRLSAEFTDIVKWLEYKGGRPNRAPWELVVIEDVAELSDAKRKAGSRQYVLSVAQMATVERQRVLWQAAVADWVPPWFTHGAALLNVAPLSPDKELPQLYTWLWASHFGLRQNDVLPVSVLRDEATPAELLPLYRWQLADFVGFLLAELGWSLFHEVTESRPWSLNAPMLHAKWVADRKQSHDPTGYLDRRVLAAWRMSHGQVAEALANLPDTLSKWTLDTTPSVVMLEGFGEATLLAGRLEFVFLWLTEGLLSAAFTRQLLRPTEPAPPAVLVPLDPLPLEAVVGAALLEPDTTLAAIHVLLRAGHLDAARLLRLLRNWIDNPVSPSASKALDDWTTTPRGNPGLVGYVKARAMQVANRADLASSLALELPEKYRLALEYTAK